MKKLLILFVAILLATSAYALVETDQAGPQNITSCYIVGAGPITSGNVVILQTSSPTYYGAEVTGTATAGQQFYGVVVDSKNYTSEDIASGEWLTVQTYGYCPLVKMAGNTAVTAATAGAHLVTSGEVWKAASSEEQIVSGETEGTTVTGSTIALESLRGNLSPAGKAGGGGHTIKAFLKW